MKPSLHRVPGTFSVHRLPPDSALPQALLAEPFYAVLRSPEELSVCCRADVPLASTHREDDWACLAVDGPLDFALTGIVSSMTTPLAEAGIPVFVISSFDTDYLLVKLDRLAQAAEVLTGAGLSLRA